MIIYYAKKEKGRIYKSELLVPQIIEAAGISMSRYTFEHLDSGAPLLAGEPPLFISISDTKNYWAAVLSDCEAGLDIEESDRRFNPRTSRALHPDEQRYLQGLCASESERNTEFLAIWTRKEAYAKLCRAGLRIGFSSFSVIDENMEYKSEVAAKNRPCGKFADIIGNSSGIIAALCLEKDSGEPAQLVRVELDAPMEIPALEKAASLLDGRAYTVKELTQKLIEKGYDAADARSASEEMKKRGYIDEEWYARRYIEKAETSGKAKKRIKQELAKKGLSPDIADSVFAENGTDELSNAKLAADKLLAGKDIDEKGIARAARRLSSLGYTDSVIYRTVEYLRSRSGD